MAILTRDELVTTYYVKAGNMQSDDVDLYLSRANAWAKGIIGGDLPAAYITADEKAAVAMAFEIFSQGETGQLSTVNGMVTNVAPTGYYVNSFDQYNPLTTAAGMLAGAAKKYKDLFPDPGTINPNGIRFL